MDATNTARVTPENLAQNIAASIEANPDLDPEIVRVCEIALMHMDAATEDPCVVNIVRCVRWMEAQHALLAGSGYDSFGRGFAWTAPWGQTFGMTPVAGGWNVQDSLSARCGFKPTFIRDAHVAAAWLARTIDCAITTHRDLT